jgi:hypothetical protein
VPVQQTELSSTFNGTYLMRIKIFEKHLFFGIALLLIGAVILLTTTIIHKHIMISEKGLLFDVVAVVSLFFSIKFILKSINQQ